jgi:hypothetical protein
MRSEADTGARKKENVMHPTNNTSSVRTLAVALAAAPLALALLAVGLYHGEASDLTPLALVLPLLSMGALDAVLERRAGQERNQAAVGERRPRDSRRSLTRALTTA